MTRKALIAATGLVCVFTAGCASARNTPAPSIAPQAASAASAPATPKPIRKQPEIKKAPRPTPLSSAPRPSAVAKTPDLAASIKGETSWTDGGKTLIVKERGSANAEPVPLFRQAIVLAKVRTVLAGSPAAPVAEFRHGMLMLTFPRGNNAEIADAANRALSAPEVNQLCVKMPH